MKTDGLFKVHTFRIPFEHYGIPIKLASATDIHSDSPHHAREEFVGFLTRVRDAGAYLLIGGDTFDTFSTSERESHKKADYHDQSRESWDGFNRGKIEECAKLILRYVPKEKIIGVGGGNHYCQFKDQTTSDQYLAFLLGCSYLGTMCFLRLKLEHGNQHYCVDIVTHHGKASGQGLGASLNSFQGMVSYLTADIYIMGHDHKNPIAPFVRLSLNIKDNLVAHKGFCIRSGCFVKTYVPNRSSYEVDRAYSPTVIGGVMIDLTPKDVTRQGVRDKYVKIEVQI